MKGVAIRVVCFTEKQFIRVYPQIWWLQKF